MRFYLHLFNHLYAPDEEGREFPDLAAAKAAAVKGGREIIAEAIALGRPVDLDHRMEVADAEGTVLAVLPFRDLVSISDGGVPGRWSAGFDPVADPFGAKL